MQTKLILFLMLLSACTASSQNKSNFEPDDKISSGTFINDICLPHKLYMLSDIRNNLFVEPLIKRWRPYNDVVRFGGSTHYTRKLQRVQVSILL